MGNTRVHVIAAAVAGDYGGMVEDSRVHIIGWA